MNYNDLYINYKNQYLELKGGSTFIDCHKLAKEHLTEKEWYVPYVMILV